MLIGENDKKNFYQLKVFNNLSIPHSLYQCGLTIIFEANLYLDFIHSVFLP